jgi:hypothetical protein
LAVALLGSFVLAGAVVLLPSGGEPSSPPLVLPSEIVGPDPLRFDGDRVSAYERAAAFGLSHVLFARSPGGVARSASRTAAFRRLVEEAVADRGFDADLLEAVVLLESAGRPDVIAGDDPQHAAGLTQILAETATNFLGMDVDLAASRRLTRKIDEARRRRDDAAVDRLQAERRQIDSRFDAAQALAGTVRYLETAKERFGQEDLAVVSYHMGIGNLEGVVRSYAGDSEAQVDDIVREHDLTYARLYFDSSPLAHRDAWERLASFGDDSQTYYWRVLAAREIMRLFRENPARLERLSELHGRGPSAELVLHPPEITRRFESAEDLETGVATGALRPLPSRPVLPFEVGPASGEPSGPRVLALRPRALALLGYLAARVRASSGAERPLRVTAAAYDEASAQARVRADARPSAHASLHSTGFSFDIRRRYQNGAQASAFQWTLERLEALGLIAWTRSTRVIHVTVSPRSAART